MSRTGALTTPWWLMALALIFMLIAGVGPVRAQASAPAVDVSLVPVDAPASVRLVSCVLVATVSCEGDVCAIDVEQRYEMHNGDRAQSADLRLRLALPAGGDGNIPQPTLRDGDQTLDPVAVADDGLLWEMSLAPNQRRTLRLTYRHSLPSPHFIRWSWDAPALEAWRTVEGIRVEFRLPRHMTEDAILAVDPGVIDFDGRMLLWEYEGLDAVRPHSLIMLTPPVWQRLRDLRANGEAHQLAVTLVDLQETAAREEVPFEDPFAEAVAALHAAIQSSPDDAAPRLTLAELYIARASTATDLTLNYLLLAAQELEEVLARGTDDDRVANLLSRVYYDAAQAANGLDDPAAALEYLQKAYDVPGADQQGQTIAREDMALYWALDLAKKGQSARAIEQLGDLLSPGMRDALTRYAPPFRSVRAEMVLEPHERIARYQMALYGPSTPTTLAWLDEAIHRVDEIPGVQMQVTPTQDPGNGTAEIEIRVAYATIAELAERAGSVYVALAEEENTLAMALAAPWQLSLHDYDEIPGRWWDRRIYRERVDLGPMQSAWQAESEYIRWRLVELGSQQPTDDGEQKETQLATIILREQRQIWESLPSASYWTYRVRYRSEDPSAAPVPWNVGWGQTRDLEATSTMFHREMIRQTLLITAGALGLGIVIAVTHYIGRRRSRSSGQV
ncbi:MAG: hypothetical protein ACOX9A_00480 [Anaerolineae bacterium]